MCESEEEAVEALSGCCCLSDPFAALPPEERPRGKSPMVIYAVWSAPYVDWSTGPTALAMCVRSARKSRSDPLAGAAGYLHPSG